MCALFVARDLQVLALIEDMKGAIQAQVVTRDQNKIFLCQSAPKSAPESAHKKCTRKDMSGAIQAQVVTKDQNKILLVSSASKSAPESAPESAPKTVKKSAPESAPK